MRSRLASFVFVAFVLIACGGSTASPLFGDGGASSSSSGGSSSGSSGTSDGGPKPTLESLETCSGPGTCVIGAAGCCGLNCQQPSEYIAFRRGEEQNVVLATCDQPGPVACPQCAAQLDGNYQAFCRAGKCAVVDIRTSDLSACSSANDCVLRYASCCQPCDGGATSNVVAIRAGREGDLAGQLCDGTQKCDQCLPTFPPNLRAVCDPGTKHCQVSGK